MTPSEPPTSKTAQEVVTELTRTVIGKFRAFNNAEYFCNCKGLNISFAYVTFLLYHKRHCSVLLKLPFFTFFTLPSHFLSFSRICFIASGDIRHIRQSILQGRKGLSRVVVIPLFFLFVSNPSSYPEEPIQAAVFLSHLTKTQSRITLPLFPN